MKQTAHLRCLCFAPKVESLERPGKKEKTFGMSHQMSNYTSRCILTLFSKMSRLKRNGNNRLFNERWLPMLELASSLLGSAITAVVGGTVVVVVVAAVFD